MDDKSFLKYYFSRLLNSIDFSKENENLRKHGHARSALIAFYFSHVTGRVRSISRPDDE